MVLGTLLFCAAAASAQTRIEDVVYMKSGGAAFTFDVVKPSKPNKAAVVFIVSGGWISDHTMIKTFGAESEKAFLEAGLTVFEVVHGAQPRYKVAEIVDQVRTAAAFVHAHAADYGVEPGRIGVTGISSGGHLSLMVGGSASTGVSAVAAIAPPTDLADWGKPDTLVTEEPLLAMFVPALGFDPQAPRDKSKALAAQLSPVTLVSASFPPTLIVHGDDDKIVPIQQAHVMDEALEKAKVDHRLTVVPGGGHDEKTFAIGVQKALEWFREKLTR